MDLDRPTHPKKVETLRRHESPSIRTGGFSSSTVHACSVFLCACSCQGRNEGRAGCQVRGTARSKGPRTGRPLSTGRATASSSANSRCVVYFLYGSARSVPLEAVARGSQDATRITRRTNPVPRVHRCDAALCVPGARTPTAFSSAPFGGWPGFMCSHLPKAPRAADGEGVEVGAEEGCRNEGRRCRNAPGEHQGDIDAQNRRR